MDSQIDNTIYETYGDRWYTAYDDPVAILRAEGKVKVPWVEERLLKHGLSGGNVLDIGCGGGFLSNHLAKCGFNVTGVDIARDSLEVASRYDVTGTVNYYEADAYQLPFEDKSFDAVAALDFLEHVEGPGRAIQEISRVLKPNGLFFFNTLNRNFLSWFLGIKVVEWFVKNTPKDMHLHRMFITPEEMEEYCKSERMLVQEMIGIRPVLSSATIDGLLTGIVPEDFRFKLTPSLQLTYLGMAMKI